MPRVIIAGSRKATYEQTRAAVVSCEWFMERVVKRQPCTIVSGKAPGSDAHGEEIARRLTRASGVEWPVAEFPADWGRLGKFAGPARNRQMAEFAAAGEGEAWLIAAWDRRIQGTANMIAEAYAHGIQVHVYDTVRRCVADMARESEWAARYPRGADGEMLWWRWY